MFPRLTPRFGMLNGPERNIEKLLKAWAQKRRADAGAPLELHPATRRMLQGEVARRTAKMPRPANVFLRFFSLLRPQLAFGVAILAVLLVATWALLPGSNKARWKAAMAAKEYAAAKKPAARAAPKVAARSAVTNATAPGTEALALALDSASQESRSATLTMQVGRELSYAETDQKAKVADLGAGGRASTAGTFGVAGVARDEARRALVAGEPAPPAQADADKRLSERYAPAKTPATPAAKPMAETERVTVGAAAEDLSKAKQEPLARDWFEKEGLGKTEVALARPAGSVSAVAPPAATPPQADLKDQALYAYFNQMAPVSFTQGFVQSEWRSRGMRAAKAVNMAEAKGILTSFQVAQVGDTLQVIDSDGSTYTGLWRSATKPETPPLQAAPADSHGLLQSRVKSAKEEGKRVVPSADKAAAPQSLGYFFQVVGTNSTLNQRVVFSGNVIVDTNTLRAIQTNVRGGSAGAFQFQQGGVTAPELQNSRISGKAVIGDVRTVEINATPVSP